MSFLAKIGAKVGGFFAGGALASAQSVSDIVAKWVPDAEARANLEKELGEQYELSQQSARQHDAPMQGASWFDSLVNGINRLIRPTITVGLFGGLFGWWDLPEIKDMDPIYQLYGETVLLFWFGGRALFKDLPAMIKYLKKT